MERLGSRSYLRLVSCITRLSTVTATLQVQRRRVPAEAHAPENAHRLFFSPPHSYRTELGLAVQQILSTKEIA